MRRVKSSIDSVVTKWTMEANCIVSRGQNGVLLTFAMVRSRTSSLDMSWMSEFLNAGWRAICC